MMMTVARGFLITNDGKFVESVVIVGKAEQKKKKKEPQQRQPLFFISNGALPSPQAATGIA